MKINSQRLCEGLLGTAIVIAFAVIVPVAANANPAGTPAAPKASVSDLATSDLAGGTDPAAAAAVTHPDQDYAGSQIAKHEGIHQVGADYAALARPTVKGLDVSSYEGSVDWSSVASHGARFAYVKATEGTGYTNGWFGQQYNGAHKAGLICGAYHFGLPNVSGGKAQADFFVAHGGGWHKNHQTLPPMLDIEYNPYGPTCYGQSQTGMAAWITSFVNEVHAKTSRWPVIYTSYNWWQPCVGNVAHLASKDPLFIANYPSTPGPLPVNWKTWTIWQFNDHGVFPGDQDLFSGDVNRLKALANG